MKQLTFRKESYAWAWLFMLATTNIDNPLTELDVFSRQYALDNQTKSDIPVLMGVLNQDIENWTHEDMYKYGLDVGLQVNAIFVSRGMFDFSWKLNNLYQTLPIKTRNDLAINGSDIMTTLRIKPGKHIGELLTKAEKAVLNGHLPNTKASLLEFVDYSYGTGY